jgi:hypothetical protein
VGFAHLGGGVGRCASGARRLQIRAKGKVALACLLMATNQGAQPYLKAAQHRFRSLVTGRDLVI